MTSEGKSRSKNHHVECHHKTIEWGAESDTLGPSFEIHARSASSLTFGQLSGLGEHCEKPLFDIQKINNRIS